MTNLNAQDHAGQTALFKASFRDQVEIAEMLIDHGASLDIRDQRGYSALRHAVGMGKNKVTKLLIDKDPREAALEMMAIIKDYKGGLDLDVIKNLITYGVNVDFQDESGMSAFMYAAKNGRTEIAQVLIECGADINLKTPEGFTVLDMAKKEGREEIVKLIDEEAKKLQKKFKDTKGSDVESENSHNKDQEISAPEKTGRLRGTKKAEPTTLFEAGMVTISATVIGAVANKLLGKKTKDSVDKTQ